VKREQLKFEIWQSDGCPNCSFQKVSSQVPARAEVTLEWATTEGESPVTWPGSKRGAITCWFF